MIGPLAFGGGCHWCTEGVVASLRGTHDVLQGFAASEPPHDNPSEAVRFVLDDDVLPLGTAIEIHLRTHASGSAHKMRGKYRSAVYVPEELLPLAREALAEASVRLDALPVTLVLPLTGFEPSPERYRRYFETRAEGPFCRTYIDPKLALLRREYAGALT